MSTFRVNTNLMSMNTLRNLGMTNNQFSGSMTRLSTGLRINSGADDPAGLQISEGFRAQITGLTQALRNNQDAINYAKTAEGALNEVSSLLRDARALVLANGNDATLSADQKQANQSQLTSILNSIDRISQQTQFGSKRVLNGSAGVSAAIIDPTKISSFLLGGEIGGTAITSSGLLTITTVGTSQRSTVVGSAVTAANLNTAIGASGNLTINGISFGITASMTWNDMIATVNARSAETGVVAGNNNVNMTFTSTKFGAQGNSISITNDVAGVGFAAAGTRNLAGGTTLGSVTATGLGLPAGVAFSVDPTDGSIWRDTSGNVLKLTAAQLGTAGATTVQVTAGTASFQVGANVGQTANLSLSSTAVTSLGLSGLDITTSAGAALAMAAIDTAITSISATRGNIGNFQRNILESNVRSLSVAKENITATESSIRDVDIAEEMTSYTKLQILQQSGLSVLAQANQAPQAVLSLLRG